ncbi:hypothetical protein DFH29DRAFT_965427 [Suillus ampliporus]|nr:hypothetical protein DFH29DRAFT_965427 [Suillus ampliporus]
MPETKLSPPRGWTDKVTAVDKVTDMLASSIDSTVANIKDILEQVQGDQYVFSSGNKFYFWNCVSDEGAVVTKPTGKEQLWKQMDTDIMRVEVKKL